MKRLELAQKCVGNIFRFLTFAIELCNYENGAPFDIGLLFEGQQFKILTHLKQREMAQKCTERLLKSRIFARMISLRKFYLMTLTYFFKVKFSR